MDMLSILIPTYNYDCTRLVHDLQMQAEHAAINYEIIVADDASPIQTYKEKNRIINTIPNCRVIEQSENMGRARIRNLLADEAQHEWLLFMDADAEVISSNFITHYLLHTDYDVICGGLCHANTLPSPKANLRYAYEKRADKRRTACHRRKRPYEQFTPFNFMIRRELYQSIRFDERITEYGHEDTLFGIVLSKQKAHICHIDNPLCHTGIDSNKEFIEKTRAALRNLVRMSGTIQGHSSLLSAHRLLSSIGIDKLIAKWFIQKEASITHRLIGENASLHLFFIYKLGYYCALKRNKQ